MRREPEVRSETAISATEAVGLRHQAALIAAICGTVAIETEYGETDQPITIPKTRKVKRPNPMWRKGDPKSEKEYPAEEIVEGEYDVALAAIGTLQTLIALEKDFDGFVIACGQDPG